LTVLTVEVAEERPNWTQIPAIREAESALDKAVRAAGRKIADAKSDEAAKVQDALAACIWECINVLTFARKTGNVVPIS
jgi:hypothetical protein